MLLAAVSTAWACTTFAGKTYFDWPNMGTTKRIGENLSLPNVWGKGVSSLDGFATDNWRLVSSGEGQCCGSGVNEMMPSNVRYDLILEPPPEAEGAQLGPTGNETKSPDKQGGQDQKFSVCWLRGDRYGKALNPSTLTVF